MKTECENCGGQGVDPADSGNGDLLCDSCGGSGYIVSDGISYMTTQDEQGKGEQKKI